MPIKYAHHRWSQRDQNIYGNADTSIRDSRRKIVALELETAVLARDKMAAEKFTAQLRRDKMAAENFTVQLSRNLAIAEYNRQLGKDVPLFPLPDMKLQN